MNYILSAIIRGSIPFIIMSLLSGIMKFQRLDDFQIKSTFITGLIVISVVAASVIYEV